MLLSTLTVLLQSRLYWPAAAYGPDRLGGDVLPQLRYLRGALAGGAGAQMQGLFPEGDFFTHVLYGLSWVQVGLRRPADAPLRAQAQTEARWAAAYLATPAGRAPFTVGLEPPYGVFYAGWTLWLRSGILQITDPAARDPAEVAAYAADCAALAAAFDRSATPFLMAYPGQAWPVDSTVAVAALRLHDTLTAPRYSATIARWIAAAQARRDPATGLLPHRVDPTDGSALDTPRASSSSIIARFLDEIDPVWGADYYAAFRRQFVTTVAGLPGVREYPPGDDRAGDVDSGPLAAGVSLSASAVTLGAALAHGDRALADPLLQMGEFAGVPLAWGDTKRYAFGLLPVGDAFLVWSKTARPWIAPLPIATYPQVVPIWWRWPLHLLGLALFALLWLPLRGRVR
ncbi:MAG: hypothetical protein M3Z04_03145 [Chloroflexota bacterium]|nr:hypothetical protein [Chloroflexota bacterium]